MTTRDIVIGLRLKRTERKELARVARRQGKKLGTFIRDAALAESSKINAREVAGR